MATELPNGVTEPDVAERIKKFHEAFAIPAGPFARAAAFAITRPEDVDVNEIQSGPSAGNYELPQA